MAEHNLQSPCTHISQCLGDYN